MRTNQWIHIVNEIYKCLRNKDYSRARKLLNQLSEEVGTSRIVDTYHQYLEYYRNNVEPSLIDGYRKFVEYTQVLEEPLAEDCVHILHDLFHLFID